MAHCLDKLCNYIFHNDVNEALALIASGDFDSDFTTDSYRNNALQLSILCDLPEVSLALIASERFDLNHLNIDKYSALCIACDERNFDVVLALLATGKINKFGAAYYKSICTALKRHLHQTVYIMLTGDIENSAVNCKNDRFIILCDQNKFGYYCLIDDPWYKNIMEQMDEIFGM